MAQTIHINEQEFRDAIRDFDKMEKSMDARYIKNRQRYYADKHFVPDMKRGSHSVRIGKMIGVTTASKYVKGKYGVRVGVVKNDTDEFPDFSAQALASVLEYGTEERFRTLRKAGLITGRQSTGRVTARPFLRPAYEKNKGPFMDDVEQALRKKFERSL